VWDFDDDNALLDKRASSVRTACNPRGGPDSVVEVLRPQPRFTPCGSFNPYPLMGAASLPSWPRGYPLRHINNRTCGVTPPADGYVVERVQARSLGVCQSLANHDPDVDAIYRLTRPIPFDFQPYASTAAFPVAVPRNALAPFNAQATMFSRDALWMLLLPVTVHGRVSDIWRSYAGQRLLREMGSSCSSLQRGEEGQACS
jgi:hypothetical protein